LWTSKQENLNMDQLWLDKTVAYDDRNYMINELKSVTGNGK